MRKISVVIVVFGLLINSAFAKQHSSEEEKIINIFQILRAQGDQVKKLGKERLKNMNLALKHLEAKFMVEQVMEYEYKDQKLQGVRCIIKNISAEPIYLSERLKGEQLLALICSKNILAPNESTIAYLVRRIV